jgi:hypothetical protein
VLVATADEFRLKGSAQRSARRRNCIDVVGRTKCDAAITTVPLLFLVTTRRERGIGGPLDPGQAVFGQAAIVAGRHTSLCERQLGFGGQGVFSWQL